jgi:[ribosomal protein S5]-alanine N-acetyltransferase
MIKEVCFIPFPVLSTSRLALRQLWESDVKDLSALRSNDAVNRYVARAKQTTLKEASAFIHTINRGIREKKWLYWAICRKEHPKLIGTICLWNFSGDDTIAEIGYELDPIYQGQGFMNEALQCVIDYSFKTIHLKALEAFTHKDNNNSIRLLLKNNFRPDADRKDGEDENNRIFTLSFQHKQIIEIQKN